jgi:hypothetical protein
MKNLTVIDARNKTFIGKVIKFNENTGIAIMGKKEYTVGFDIHQPNKESGDYSVVEHKLEDLKAIKLYRTDSEHQNKGIWIEKYKIN